MENIRPDVDFEASDVELRPALIAGVSLYATVFAICTLLTLVFGGLREIRKTASAKALPVQKGFELRPPEPRLQRSPTRDIEAYRHSQLTTLRVYHWTDRGRALAGIPIERAMEQVAASGIPSQVAPESLKLVPPQAGTRLTGFETQTEQEPLR